MKCGLYCEEFDKRTGKTLLLAASHDDVGKERDEVNEQDCLCRIETLDEFVVVTADDRPDVN